jgi:adenine/guanine/hypoxanthine permease
VIEGLVALVLVLAGLRTAIMEAVPHSLKLAIGVGIGLFITLVWDVGHRADLRGLLCGGLA